MGSEQWAHRQGSKFHSCVHTSTDASEEGLSINNEISNFYTGSLQKAQLSPDFGKSLLIQMPSSPVGAQKTDCPLGFGLSCVGGGFWHEEGWGWGLAAGTGAGRTAAGQALEGEAETVRETGSQ